jgi:exodeoxyribonuclease X-like protein
MPRSHTEQAVAAEAAMAEAQGDQDRAFHIEIDRQQPVGPGPAASSSFDPQRIDFGHHAGRTIEELAEADPDYLRWLERHPSGARYRAEIHRVLGVVPRSTDWER